MKSIRSIVWVKTKDRMDARKAACRMLGHDTYAIRVWIKRSWKYSQSFKCKRCRANFEFDPNDKVQY